MSGGLVLLAVSSLLISQADGRSLYVPDGRSTRTQNRAWREETETFHKQQPYQTFHFLNSTAPANDSDDKGSSLDFGERIFNNSMIKWRVLSYPVQKNLNDEFVDTILREAFKTWSRAAAIDFVQVQTTNAYTSDVDIDITFMGDKFDYHCRQTFEDLVLAHTLHSHNPGYARIHFNGDYTWTVSETASCYKCANLMSVAIHEIGHALGLRHSGFSDSIMQPNMTVDVTRPSDEDLSSLRLLYGYRIGLTNEKCQAGRFYCGRELTKIGYDADDPDYLYECHANAQAAVVGFCPRGCLQQQGDGDSYCSCIVGLKYCGYELKWRNFPHSANFSDHTLYNCDKPDKVTKWEKCTDMCRSEWSDSKCDESFPCKVGARYCGRELPFTKMEGLKRHGLYECQNTTEPAGGVVLDKAPARNVTYIGMCKYGCVLGTEEKDAMCRKP